MIIDVLKVYSAGEVLHMRGDRNKILPISLWVVGLLVI
jgi:hypothetical protein